MAKASKLRPKKSPAATGKQTKETTTVQTGTLHDSGELYQTAAAKVGHRKYSNYDAGHWLGISNARSGKKASPFDYIRLSNAGITRASINTLADYIGVSRKYISENIFDVSVKTMERKDDNERLNRKISSHALEIAKLVQHAYTVFRDEENVKRWLNRGNRALNNWKPVELLDTLTGLLLVDDVLGRIEEGVYA